MIERYSKPGPIRRFIRRLRGEKPERLLVDRLRVAVAADRAEHGMEADPMHESKVRACRRAA